VTKAFASMSTDTVAVLPELLTVAPVAPGDPRRRTEEWHLPGRYHTLDDEWLPSPVRRARQTRRRPRRRSLADLSHCNE
jgi:hypothetical protein